MKKAFPFKWLFVLVALLGAIFWFLPWLFVKAVAWQQVFNQLTSENLHAIQQNPVSAGLILIGVSFLMVCYMPSGRDTANLLSPVIYQLIKANLNPA